MRIARVNFAFLLGMCAGVAYAVPQDSPSEALEKQLKAQFVPTKLAADHVKVATAGTILTVKKDGIGAISPNGGMSAVASTQTMFYPSNYKGGTMKHSLSGKFMEHFGSVRDFDVDEKVYLVKLEIKDPNIVVSVQSCGTCDPKKADPEHTPARAAVSFQFAKGYLETTKADEIGKIISHVFAPVAAEEPAQQTTEATPPAGGPSPAQVQPVATQAPPPTVATPLAPIPPPPPPTDAAPAEIAIGQTPDQVKAAMGTPDRVVKAGTKEIYLYKSIKVTFLKGKVSSIE